MYELIIPETHINVSLTYLIPGVLALCYLLNLFIVRYLYSREENLSGQEREFLQLAACLSFVFSPLFLVLVYPIALVWYLVWKLLFWGLK